MPDASLTIDGVEVLKKTSGEINLTNTNFVPNSSFMFRNKIINGNFDIWQRNTSFTITNSTNTYSADRWRFLGDAFDGTLTRENFGAGQTEVPNSPDYFAKWTVTDNPLGNMAFGQYIENVRTLAGKTATLSLYLKSSSTISANKLQIRYRQVTGGTGGTNNTVNIGEITTSWKKFTFQLDIPSLTGATLGAPNVSYLTIEILSPSAHTSTFDLSIAQVQLEEGTVATPFEHRPMGIELGLCQRYCTVMSLSNLAGRGSGASTSNQPNGSVVFGVSTPTTMRAVPTVRSYSGTIYVFTPSNSGSSTGAIGIDTGTLNLTFPAHFRLALGGVTYVSDNRCCTVEISGLQLEAEL